MIALASAVALWASFPPLNLWPLAWVAPVGWLSLIAKPSLPGRHPYLAIWSAASVHWLLMLEGIRLAHPLLYMGWIALSLYIAVYIVLFIGLTRIAVHRWRISIVIAAPLVWTGLELAKAHVMSGFAMGLIGHSQMAWTRMIQVADLGGAYAVGTVMICVSACLVRATPWGRAANASRGDGSGDAEADRLWNWWPLAVATGVAGLCLTYGTVRLRSTDDQGAGEPVLRAALVQGSFNTFYEYDPEVNAEIFARYLELSEQAVAEDPDLDLVVWPESVFAGNLGEVLASPDTVPPPELGLSQAEYGERILRWQQALDRKYRDVAGRLNPKPAEAKTYLFGGTDTQELKSSKATVHNSAVGLDPAGQVVGRYYKMHLVIFGEYLPLGNLFPWIYSLTPMPQGITPGTEPQSFPVSGATVVPSICFESTVPHLIRRQVRHAAARAKQPLVLVNVTNDGWFWGSSMLDMHLACAVFRSIENRRPMLVAANTGISAYIDGSGRVICQGPRQQDRVLYAQVTADARNSTYGRIGDVWAGICLVFCLGLAIVGLVHRRQAVNPSKRAE